MSKSMYTSGPKIGINKSGTLFDTANIVTAKVQIAELNILEYSDPEVPLVVVDRSGNIVLKR